MSLLAKIGLILLNVTVFFFEEGWIIAMVAFFPFWLAIVFVTILLSTFAAISTYLSGLANLPPLIERWMTKKKAKAGERLQEAVKSSLWFSFLATAVIISPTLSAVMMQMSGIKGKKAYVSDFLLSFVSGTIWCFIYGGGILILKKIF